MADTLKVQNLEWKLLVKEISRHITKKDIETLCFFAKEYIPAGEREEITQPIQLMNHFEDKLLIGESNVEFLKAMLDYIGRKNLVVKVEEYKDNMKQQNSCKKSDREIRGTTTSAPPYSRRGKAERSPRPLSQEFSSNYNTHHLNTHAKVSKSKSASNVTRSPALLTPAFFLGNSTASSKQPEESQERVIGQPEISGGQQPKESSTNKSDVEKYNMDSTPVGKCIIINNMFEEQVITTNGTELPYRKGSDKDVLTLKRVFKWLKFDVEAHNNVKMGNMMNLLEAIAQDSCNENIDCFVCCILSHGFEKGFYSSDGCECYLSNLKNIFKGDKAPSLHGKPKLFFIQACQGKDRGEGAKIESDSPCFPSATTNDNEERAPPDQKPPVHRPPVGQSSLSTEADFLFCLATTPGTLSYRDTSIGSWFIQEFGEVLKSNAEYNSLNDMLLSLNGRIAKKEAVDRDGITAKMMSDFGQNTMTKNLYFRPGISFDEFWEEQQTLQTLHYNDIEPS